jgi:Phosphorylase superfamily
VSRPADSFDAAVSRAARALAKRGVPAPRALLYLATGLDLLPERLERAESFELLDVDGVPPAYLGSRLHCGELFGSTVWVLEDLSNDPQPRARGYELAFPVWLAAQSGARVLLHASAGSVLPRERSLVGSAKPALQSRALPKAGAESEPAASPDNPSAPSNPARRLVRPDLSRLRPPPAVSAAAQRLLQAAKAKVEAAKDAAIEAVESSVETVAMEGDPGPPEAGGLLFVSDHINVSGRSPLEGLGESRLGPLFPDQSRLHDLALRRAALEMAQGRGLFPSLGIVACTPAPHLDTPAECRAWARLGASAAVQGLATPLIAAAHAGLSTLALVALIDTAGEQLAVRRLLERAEKAAPLLEEGLIAAAEALAGLHFEGEEEGEPRPKARG